MREVAGSRPGHAKDFEIVLVASSLDVQYNDERFRGLSDGTLSQGPLYRRFTFSMIQNQMEKRVLASYVPNSALCHKSIQSYWL